MLGIHKNIDNKADMARIYTIQKYTNSFRTTL